MTVSGDFRIDFRPYAGYVDPSLPIAAYIAQGALIGDASGGTVNFSFIYQRNDDAQISELFNLEQLAVDSSINGPQAWTMRLVAMDSLSPNRPAFGQIWALDLDSTSGGLDNALPLRSGTMLPLWFGSPNRDEGDGLIRFIVTNTDLQLYAVTIQGYVWGPRSVMAPGGPQRPIGALFGR